jgi:hypothetical protein
MDHKTMTSCFSDSELTARALMGERDAFTQIVMRYQSLVCSLAYSAIRNLSQSEDLGVRQVGLGCLPFPNGKIQITEVDKYNRSE